MIPVRTALASVFVAAAAVMELAVVAPAAAAPNLLTNPGFDASLAGWQVVGTASWHAFDASGSPDSGSVLGSFDGAVTGLVPIVSQCVALTPGATYHLGGEIFIPGGQTAPGSAFFLMVQYPTPDCSGPPPPGPFLPTPAVTAVNAWTGSFQTIQAFGGSGQLAAYLAPAAAGHLEASFDNLVVAAGPLGCVPDAFTLCLLGSRFRVTATYSVGSGSPANAHAVPIGVSGYLWFFDSGNVEALLKMIDGCALGGHYWFFAAGLTNLHVVFTVTDTQTGAIQTYSNPAETAFQPIQDTAAFACQ